MAGNFREMCARFTEEEDAIRFFQTKRILHEQRRCVCGNPTKLTETNADRQGRWRCYRGQCMEELSLRTGTWFQGHRLDFRTAAMFIYRWSHGYTTTEFCSNELGMSVKCAVEWKKWMREVAAESLLRNPPVTGGSGLTVEVDETVYSRRKYQRGRTYPQQWVFRACARRPVSASLCPLETVVPRP
uniref:ISXO2-like transposase domain-containing protein n=1 Tax=Trichuris muris TaxID=70415 RepID=A0A5S6QKD7_TRIMR